MGENERRGWGVARKLNFEPGLIEMKNKFSKLLAA